MSKKTKGKKKNVSASKSKGKAVPSFFYQQKTQLAIIFLLGFLLYGNTLNHDFTQDDAIVIYENDFTKKGLEGIPDILSKDTFHGFFGEQKNLVEGGRYRPLSLVLFAIEYEIFGESTFIGHLGNILLYGLTCMLVYLFLTQLLNPRQKQEGMGPWFIVFAATVLFTVHPLHTEAVANIKGRDEIMALLFSLLAACLAFKSFHEKEIKYSLLAGFMIFLGLLSKENAINFVMIIPVAFFFFTKAKIKDIAIQMLPIIAGTLVFLVIRASIISSGSASLELMNNPFVEMNMSEKFATVTYTLGKYVQLLIAPIVLTHDYYPYHIPKTSWSDWKVLLSLLLYLGMGVFGLYALLKVRTKEENPSTGYALSATKIIGFSVIFFLLSIIVISNLIFPIGTFMSERFMFMPSIGFALLLSFGLWKIGAKAKDSVAFKDLKIPFIILLLVGGLYGMKTISRNFVWKDNYTLFTTDVKVSKNSAKLNNAAAGEIIAEAVAEKNAGIKAMNQLKDPAQRKAKENQVNQVFEPKIKQAIGYLLVSTKIHPTYSNAYLQLGNAHNYIRQYRKAFEYLKLSLAYKENSKDALNNLGITYRDAANYIAEQNKREQFSDAMGYFKESINYFDRLQPYTTDQEGLKENKAQTYRDWGKFYGERINNFQEALKYLDKAKDLNANDNETYRLIGLCYASMGQTGEAITLFEGLLQKQPENANIMFNLGNFYRQTGQEERGIQLVQKAMQIDPSLGR